MMRPILYAIAAPAIVGCAIFVFGGWIKLMISLDAAILAATANEELARGCATLVGVFAPIGFAWGVVFGGADEEHGQ
jgi:hypothetical protein